MKNLIVLFFIYLVVSDGFLVTEKAFNAQKSRKSKLVSKAAAKASTKDEGLMAMLSQITQIALAGRKSSPELENKLFDALDTDDENNLDRKEFSVAFSYRIRLTGVWEGLSKGTGFYGDDASQPIPINKLLAFFESIGKEGDLSEAFNKLQASLGSSVDMKELSSPRGLAALRVQLESFVDINHDDKIQFEEYVQFAADPVFKTGDKDKNGKLTQGEFYAVFLNQETIENLRKLGVLKMETSPKELFSFQPQFLQLAEYHTELEVQRSRFKTMSAEERSRWVCTGLACGGGVAIGIAACIICTFLCGLCAGSAAVVFAGPCTECVITDTASQVQKSGGCLSSLDLAFLKSGASVPLTDLKVGDEVMVGPNKYSRVFVHRSEGEDVEMVRITFEKEDGQIGDVTLTPNHLIYARNPKVRIEASKVQIGDILHFVEKEKTVAATVSTVRKVMSSPMTVFTLDGYLVVNGVEVSSFTQSIVSLEKYLPIAWGLDYVMPLEWFQPIAYYGFYSVLKFFKSIHVPSLLSSILPLYSV